MDRVLVFLLGLPLGIMIMVYRSQLKEITGDIDWAERNLGSGGTYNLIIIIGVVVSVLSVMYGFGSLQALFKGSFGMFFR